ncbi:MULTISPECIES: DotG/IcmE/VirB10 family protein [Burkholderia cepacia complex]|uniref:Conjugal transfer protein TraO n=1 Tax=Burkholderia cepacia TaxID=292 RepID=A0AAX2RKP3_BURCE|nr:DotG/IcmE/VirB10 family protein [Burkholderia cepacia]TES99658.1 conjugal transfer protein TraO [Burkholderia cepacia]TEU41651.1 conjugal transfer protein TraO [Burkholderia cepacia]TEU48721.1 conjugal transfer protein TraO [Burkholderia cepacia]TEU95392.1 conjugal transfer protein TraO [Burkholderia cepacia]TEV04786.1 conjugal transfer protein TraO [Burkholderia cepacia]
MAGNDSRKLHPGFMRNAKVIGGIVVLAVVCAGVAYAAMKHRKDQAAQFDIPTVDSQGGTPSQETPHYTQALNSQNQEGLAKAQKTGSTFVPALSDNSQLEQQLQQRNDNTPPERIDYQHPGGSQQAQQAQQLPPLPAPSPGVSQQLQSLANQWDNPPQSQEVLGLQKQGEQTAAATAAQRDMTGAPTGAAQARTAVIKDSAKYYAHLENGIDTSVPSDVLAVLDQGPCKGSELRGTGKLTNQSVSATFSTMTCQGRTVAIDAVALNDKTLSNALPADIDHHIPERVLIPGILGALGAAGSVYSNAGSTVTQNAIGGVTQVNNPNPSGKQLIGAGVSGGIQGMQGVIQQEVSSIPAITGRVEMNTPVLILFRQDVIIQ